MAATITNNWVPEIQIAQMGWIMKSSKMTQQQLAYAVGTTDRQVRRWAAGTSELPLETLFKLALIASETIYGYYPKAIEVARAEVLEEINRRMMVIEKRMCSIATRETTGVLCDAA